MCGGGTAGTVVAARLVEAGRRVLLLEAGPDHGAFAEGRWPAELLDARTLPFTHDWGYTSGHELPGRSLNYERARVIGGCSAHNGCTVSWGHRADYDGWAALGLDGWAGDDLLPLFRETSSRLRVRRFADDEIAPFHGAFIEAGIAMDLPELVISADTLVDRVLVENGRAVGVAAHGPEGVFEARADLVIVAGGAYGSPAILLRSGIGPSDELRELGVEVIEDLPVGRNLHDQPSFELLFAPSDELKRRTTEFEATGRTVPDEQGFAKGESGRAQAAGEPFDLHVFPEISLDGRLGVSVALLTPRSRGALTLGGLDPGTAPRLDHAYLSDPDGHDIEALLDGIELGRTFASTEPFASMLDRELEPGPAAPARHDLREAVRAGAIHYWHPVGTCAMGAVTDRFGHVLGVDGLVVADASVMPAAPRATTNVPTVVVAERIIGALTGAA
ncbi:MAG: GMC oxidoreductase [Actinomycetota bacterium]